MYDALLQSNNRPFRATPDKKFYFPSDSVENARQTAIRATLRAEGPVLILGGAGLGKSLLANVLTADLGPRFDIVSMHAAQLCSRRALLQNILFELGLPYRDLSEGELRLSILDRLVPSPETAPDGVLFIVDEAQTLPVKLLDELRLITNFTRNNQPRARLVLLGGLRLEDVFAQPQLDSFNQRLAARCYLQPMSRTETHNYIRHQLTVAKVDADSIITPEALEMVYAASDGLPRLTNQLMDHALVLAAAEDQGPITPKTIEEAWADLQQLPAPWHSGEDARQTGSDIEFGTLDDAAPAESDASNWAVSKDSDQPHAVEFGPVETAVEPLAGETTALEAEALEPTDTNEVVETFEVTETAAIELLAQHESQLSQDADTESVESDILHARGIDALPSLNDDLTLAEESSIEVGGTTPNFFAAFSESDEDVSAADQPALNDKVAETVTDATESADEALRIELTDTFPTTLPVPAAQIETPATRDTSDGFFDNKPTDEQLLAFADEQSQFESMAVWENDPPLAHVDELKIDSQSVKTHFETELEESSPEPEPDANEDVAQSEPALNQPAALFGDDFEEEFSVGDTSLGTQQFSTSNDSVISQFDTGVSSEQVSDELTSLSSQTESVEFDSSIEVAQPAFVEADVEPQPSEDLPVEATSAAEASEQAASDIVAELNQATAEEANAESDEDFDEQEWSVEVASHDVESEVALQGEIEDIVSQLNFSAFAVEPYSVEQLPEESEPTTAIPDDAIRQGKDDEVYLLHRPLADETADGVLSQAVDFDDDRDLLVIEEDIPVADRKPAVDENQSTTQTVGYSQLFAKLRR